MQKLYEIASLSEDAKEFLTGDLGKYLESRAQEEINELINQLINEKPATFLQRLLGQDSVLEIQQNIKLRQQALDWIGECIEAGNEALEQLTNEE